MMKPIKAYTHGGIFHSDDVFAAALLTLVNPNIKIHRVNQITDEMRNEPDTIIFDIGGGKYDHHTKETQEFRDPETKKLPYASFGKVFRDYFPIIDERPEVFDYVEKNLVIGIDAHDCGALNKPNELAMAINSFNPTTDEPQTPKDMDMAFSGAVWYAIAILNRYIAKAKAQVNSDTVIKRALEEKKANSHYIVLEKYASYGHLLKDTDVNWVIYPSLRGGIQAFSVIDANGNKDLFDDKDLELMAKDEHVTFVHPNKFTAVFTDVTAATQYLDRRDLKFNAKLSKEEVINEP